MTNSLSDLKILLVEDEVLIAMDIQAEIEAEGGIVVETCSTRKAAVLAAADCIFDAAIIDLNLRDGDALEVGELLQSRKLPFVFATGDPTALSSDGWANVPVFSKPGRARDLVKMLCEHIAVKTVSARP